ALLATVPPSRKLPVDCSPYIPENRFQFRGFQDYSDSGGALATAIPPARRRTPSHSRGGIGPRRRECGADVRRGRETETITPRSRARSASASGLRQFREKALGVGPQRLWIRVDSRPPGPTVGARSADAL